MTINLMNALVVQMIAEQQEKEADPGMMIAAALLPGIAGIALPLFALQSDEISKSISAALSPDVAPVVAPAPVKPETTVPASVPAKSEAAGVANLPVNPDVLETAKGKGKQKSDKGEPKPASEIVAGPQTT